MSKYIFKRYKSLCIDCGACVALAPSFFNVVGGGKVKLVRKGFGEEYFKKHKDVVESCPVEAIKIYKK